MPHPFTILTALAIALAGFAIMWGVGTVSHRAVYGRKAFEEITPDDSRRARRAVVITLSIWAVLLGVMVFWRLSDHLGSFSVFTLVMLLVLQGFMEEFGRPEEDWEDED